VVLTRRILQPDIDTMTSTEKSVEISRLRAELERTQGEVQTLTDDNNRLRDSWNMMNTIPIDTKEELIELKAKLHSVLYCMSYYTSVVANMPVLTVDSIINK
jgi:hypothetical protein